MSEFKKGDYIVLTKGKSCNYISLNTCYKQRITSTYIELDLDNKGYVSGWIQHPFNKSKDNDWRYATKQEIEEYDRLGKPYDVSTLEKEFVLPKQWYIEVTTENAEILNEWKQKVNPYSYNAKECKYVNCSAMASQTVPGGSLITFDQFKKYVLKDEIKSKELTIDDLVEGEIYKFKWVDSVEYIWKFNSCKAINITRSTFNHNFFTPDRFSFANGKLATPEEKKWLNTCIKQDKFIPKEDLDQYDNEGELVDIYKNNPPDYQNVLDIKVGDTVKCVSEENVSKFDGDNGVGWKANLEFVVKNIDNYGKYKVYFGDDQGHGVYSDTIRLIKRKESNPKFEVGKWYYYEHDGDVENNYYLKCIGYDDKEFKYSEYIKISIAYHSNFKETTHFSSFKNYREASLKEIQQYLPDGHPDKIEEDKSFEFNRWYKLKHYPNYLAYLHENGKYGFNDKNDWFENTNKAKLDGKWELASDEEVKERLLEYAKKKYPKGTKFKSAYDIYNNFKYSDTRVVNDTLQFYPNTMHDIIYNMVGPSVYYKGIWAEIVESTKKTFSNISVQDSNHANIQKIVSTQGNIKPILLKTKGSLLNIKVDKEVKLKSIINI